MSHEKGELQTPVGVPALRSEVRRTFPVGAREQADSFSTEDEEVSGKSTNS
jgi:hypothetical protein